MSGEVIFCFGSNLAGRHGLGAALTAKRHYGAKYGVGEGPTGKAYAIPTKDASLRTLPLEDIRAALVRFREYARARSDLTFALTPIGCGLAGHDARAMAGIVLSVGLPPNVVLTTSWLDHLAADGSQARAC